MYRDTSQLLDEHDRAVGAILIGEAIIDDCERAVCQSRTSVQPQDRWRAIGGVHDAYPEIWRAFDRARKVLAQRGANTAAYDEMRPHARRAASDPGLDGERAIDTAAFDDARRALEQLKLAVPGADWAAIATRTQGLVKVPLDTKKRRARLMIGAGLAGFALLVVGWLFAIVPVHKQSRREAMRQELKIVDHDRKARIADLSADIGTKCAPADAHELMRLLVLDGRGLDARAFASDYTARCGEDTVIAHWAKAPLPHH